MSRAVPFAEVFGPTLQGEGAMAGAPTFFARVGGCDYRCAWCDSLHAVLPQFRQTWTPYDAHALVAALRHLGAYSNAWITLSGGNPALHGLSEHVEAMRNEGWRVAVETQASRFASWLRRCHHVCASPKPPSSHNATPVPDVVEFLEQLMSPMPDGLSVSLKIVVFDDADYAYAARVFAAAPDHLPRFLSVGNTVTTPSGTTDEPIALTRGRLLDAYARLAERASRDPRMANVRVLPQLHALAWGNGLGV